MNSHNLVRCVGGPVARALRFCNQSSIWHFGLLRLAEASRHAGNGARATELIAKAALAHKAVVKGLTGPLAGI